MNTFLKLKHWQIFGLIACTYLAYQVAGKTTVSVTWENTTTTVIYYSPLVILFIAVLWGWLYSIGVSLTQKTPDTVKMNLTMFKWCMIFLLSFLLITHLSAYLGFFNSLFYNVRLTWITIFILIPLTLFSLFCIVYCFYFNGKALKAAELQSPVTFRDYAGEFCLFLLFPIGIWVIQPKLNEMFEKPHQVAVS